jgi:hypothetical protein
MYIYEAEEVIEKCKTYHNNMMAKGACYIRWITDNYNTVIAVILS